MKRPLTLFGLVLLAGTMLPAQEDWFRAGTGLGVEKIRVAAPRFPARRAELSAQAETFNAVLRNDLELSGLVELVSESFHPLTAPAQAAELVAEQWSGEPTKAHAVALGNLEPEGEQLAVNAWLFDVRNPRVPPVIEKRYRGARTEEDARRLAHQFADEILARLGGGAPGITQTRIAFVSDRSGTKEIWTMDYDGFRQEPVTRYGSLCLTPRWSPDASRLAFTAYDPGPGIHLYSLISQRRLAFPNYGGTTTTPAWSPDGARLAFSSSRSRDPEIYVAASDGSNLTRLTHSRGVDVSPAWNPRTGAQIAFVSDRSGRPQIYLMDSNGGNLERLTDGEGYAASPAWSPNGQLLAFHWQKDGGAFDIYVMEVATRRVAQLTREAGRNEQPSWAADGRHLVFESTRSGRAQIWMMLADGSALRQLTFEGSNTSPQWSWR